MAELPPERIASDVDGDLGRLLGNVLVQAQGMNDCLAGFLRVAGRVFDAPRLALYDYDEQVDTFDLLWFRGFSSNGRSELRCRRAALDLRGAVGRRDPYLTQEAQPGILLPLYFLDTLEAVLLLETQDPCDLLDPARRAELTLLSRFLGLFMSSSRLPVNQRAERVAAAGLLERAREVQLSYLPGAYALSECYEIYGLNHSSMLIGGDYFDYFCRRNESLQFVIADACGHGMPAARTICVFRDLLHAAASRLDDLSLLFDVLNRQLYESTDQLQYLTGVFFDYDEQTRRLQYFNAGHFEPLLIHADGTSAWLPGGGLPLGMFEAATYEIGSCVAHPGDLLVLFTDGIVEVQAQTEEFFGVNGIAEVALRHRHLPLRELGAEVLNSAARYSEVEPHDDLTLFLVKFA